MRITTLILILVLTGLAVRAFADDSYFLQGTYEMKIKIGDRFFLDELRVEPADTSFIRYPITGSITVPGVFMSPLQGDVQCNLWANSNCTANFTIIAHENGGEFNVHYRAVFDFTDTTILKGDAYLDNNVHLGSFTATKKNETP